MIQSFADKNRVKCRKDDCGILTIEGNRGSICEQGSGKFNVLASFAATRTLNRFDEFGFKKTQSGQSEAVYVVSEKDLQSKIDGVCEMLKIRRLPVLSDEVREMKRENALKSFKIADKNAETSV